MKEVKKNCCRLRYLVIFMLSLGTFLITSQRLSLATNLLCMNEDPSLNYSIKVKSDLQSYFFIGYSLGQIPLSLSFKRIGVRYPVAVIFFLFGLITFISPFVAKTSLVGFYVLRFLSGLTGSCWYPSVFNILPKWIPPYELNVMQTLVYSGLNLGAVTSPFITHQLCETNYSFYTPFIFYGGFSMVFCMFYAITITDNALVHWAISSDEKEYLKREIHLLNDVKMNPKRKRVPLKKILTCLPLWASGLCHIASDWGAYLLFTSAANYLQDFYGFTLKWNSIIQGLAMLGLWCGQGIFTLTTALLIKRSKWRLITIRKLMNFFGFILPSSLLYSLYLLKATDGIVAVALLTLTTFLSSASFLGSYMSLFDCAPTYSGEIFAVINTIGAVAGFMAPKLTGLLVEKYGDYGWRYTFALAATLNLFSCIIFFIFGEAHLQSWEVEKPTEEEVETKVSLIDDRNEKIVTLE